MRLGRCGRWLSWWSCKCRVLGDCFLNAPFLGTIFTFADWFFRKLEQRSKSAHGNNPKGRNALRPHHVQDIIADELVTGAVAFLANSARAVGPDRAKAAPGPMPVRARTAARVGPRIGHTKSGNTRAVGDHAEVDSGILAADNESGPHLRGAARHPLHERCQLTLICIVSSPSSPTMCTAQAMQGSKLWIVRRISKGCSGTARLCPLSAAS